MSEAPLHRQCTRCIGNQKHVRSGYNSQHPYALQLHNQNNAYEDGDQGQGEPNSQMVVARQKRLARSLLLDLTAYTFFFFLN